MKRRCHKCYWSFEDTQDASCCPRCGMYFAAKRYRCRKCHIEFEEPTRLNLCPRCAYPAPAQI